MGRTNTFLGSAALGALLADIAPIRCLDIGARGGPTHDLDPLASSTEVFCFEPDQEECDRLNLSYAAGSSFRSVRFFPVALSAQEGKRSLKLTEHRGTSSMLDPLPEVGRKFSRPRYTTVEKTVEIDTVPLDDFLAAKQLTDISYMKIDVEGLELEILRSATNLLSSSLLAIRSEVTFMPYRAEQPTYADIDHFLRPYHFLPMGFAELHHWRRFTTEKHLRKIRGPLPFSRGEMVHGDMVFMRDPDSVPAADAEGLQQLLKLAFIAMTYAFIDQAVYIFRLPEVSRYLSDHYGFDIEKELKKASLTQATNFRRKRLAHLIPRGQI